MSSAFSQLSLIHSNMIKRLLFLSIQKIQKIACAMDLMTLLFTFLLKAPLLANSHCLTHPEAPPMQLTANFQRDLASILCSSKWSVDFTSFLSMTHPLIKICPHFCKLSQFKILPWTWPSSHNWKDTFIGDVVFQIIVHEKSQLEPEGFGKDSAEKSSENKTDTKLSRCLRCPCNHVKRGALTSQACTRRNQHYDHQGSHFKQREESNRYLNFGHNNQKMRDSNTSA